MDTNVATSGLAPFSLKEVPALIERVFPAQKIGIESQKERKAGAGQTLTALGSYWKGRKPLVLVRAVVLASLLPATDSPQVDLEIFDILMRMDDDGMWRRNPKVTAAHVWNSSTISMDQKVQHIWPHGVLPSKLASVASAGAPKWIPLVAKTSNSDVAAIRSERSAMMKSAFQSMSFSQKVFISERTEEVESLGDENDPLYAAIWGRVNKHLSTTAGTLSELIKQLGIARFGRRPVVGDPFCGGGSIPFEAARIGCDVVASDLNPVAAMLTWGALNIIGASEENRQRIAEEQRSLIEAVDSEIKQLGIEHDSRNNRAKAYLYCLEVVDPQTGWRIPMSPSWIITVSCSNRHHREVAVRWSPNPGQVAKRESRP